MSSMPNSNASRPDKYLLPEALEPDLLRVRTYWDGLKRGEAQMPFSDDVNLSSLSDLAGDALLLEVFENPLRFRINIAGQQLTRNYGSALEGKFTDEITLRPPLDELTEQCLVTVRRRAPSYHRRPPTPGRGGDAGYARLVLPLWGNGRVETLLCTVVAPR
ncbi:MAG TPA: hypothetical protein VG985_04140 [Xanthobacteraceae bacterium]|nr:hypothetical protein [Xanthobacteraceae bacterium]